jgi:photosystem II stability/assembly factor-like uncharacterized protein
MIKRYYFLILIILLFPFIINAQSGWFALGSGTGNNLNGVDFMTTDYVIVVGDGGIILKTTDGGASWDNITSGTAQNLNSISIINNSTAIAVGDAGTVLKTTDSGNSWQTVSSNVTDNLLSVSFNGANGIAGALSQTIIYSTDAGSTWITSQSGFFGGGFWGVQMLDAANAFVAGENSIFAPLFGKSTNSGQNWDFTSFYLNSNEGRLYGVHFFDPDNGITAASVFTGEGAISMTSDGGANWSTLPFFTNALYSLNFPASQVLVGYAVGSAGIIIKTTNGGNNWTVQQSGTSNTLSGVVFADELTGYAVGENGTILKTISGGVIPVELTSFNAKLEDNNVELSWQTSTETNNSGFYVQRKAGSEWENLDFVQGYGTTTEEHLYTYVDNLENLNYRGKIYYRLKQVDNDGSVEYSHIAEINYSPKPDEFALEQNYPNPFNPTTYIKYSLPEGTHVKLTVYDLLGNEVETLVDGNKPAGTYTAKFNGANLTSGIYIYRLQAGDFVSTKRMVLIK